MKKVSLLMLSLCLLVSACKDKDAPKSPEEVKEAAIERVQDFLEDLYDKDVDGDLEHCLGFITWDEKYGDKYPFPGTAYRAALQHNVEYSPKDFVYNENVKEFRTKDHLDYVRVETRYKGKKIWFNLYFDGRGKTGTEGEARIISTAGLYKYDNDAFKKKAGFDLIYDESYDDLTPYLQRWGALHSVNEVKAYLRKVKRTDIQIISVKLSDDWLSQINSYDKVSRYEVNCSDSVKFFITDKHDGKYKITKKQGI